jgi:HK97 family phage major capsid protein
METVILDDFKQMLELERAAVGRTIDAKVDALRKDHDQKLRELGQRVSKPPGGPGLLETAANDFGAQLMANEAYGVWLRSPLAPGMKFAAALNCKGLFTKAAVSGVSPTIHIPGIIAPQYLQPRLRAFLTIVPVASGTVEYTRESGFTNAAAIVPEATRKPESLFTFQNQTAQVVTTAHYAKVSRQALADQAEMEAFLNLRLALGVQLKEEDTFINGTAGLLVNAQTIGAAFLPVSGGTTLDAIAGAISQLQAGGYNPDCLILAGSDAAQLRVIKATTGQYLWSDPASALATARTWGIPTILSPSLAAGTFLVAALRQGTVLFDRETLSLVISFENEDDFVNNLATIRAELRSVLVVTVPAAILKGTATW